jgi:DNA primase
MNLQQLKQIVRIADYLNTEEKEKEFYIHSPFRSEKTPSFKINPNLNTWYDFGAGFGGTILDLVMKLENKDTKQAVKRLRELAGDTTSNSFFSFPQHNNLNTTQKIIDYEIKPLSNKILLNYLKSRKIDYRASKQHLKEIYYKVRDKSYFGLAFRNDSNGFEIRNKYFKGVVGKKDITTITGEKKKDEVVVFEGFMDFLSYLTIKPNTGKDFIILNSVSLVDKSIQIISRYDNISLALDNDNAGDIATQKIIKHIPYAKDVRKFYKNYKDLNEFIKNKKSRPLG